jgi:3-oxoacyl-[acyl-carrier protein] reductase
MDLDLKDKRALVTASSGGIGKAIAIALAREGAIVIINGRTKKAVDAALADIRKQAPGAKLEALAADNGTVEGTEETIAKVPEVDILVNNLGIYEAVGFFEETDAAWQRLFDVNVMSGVRLSRHYLKRMLARNSGRVIFVSSESALNPAPEMAHYSATKTMQLSLSGNLAQLTKGTTVTVNTVLPGPTRTEGVEGFISGLYPGLTKGESEKRFLHENRPTTLIERLIDPQEIGDLVAYVASPRAAAINGAALRIEGGLLHNVV